MLGFLNVYRHCLFRSFINVQILLTGHSQAPVQYAVVVNGNNCWFHYVGYINEQRAIACRAALTHNKAIKVVLIKVNKHKYWRKTISLSFPLPGARNAMWKLSLCCGNFHSWHCWVWAWARAEMFERCRKYIKICANNNKTYKIIDIGCIKIATQCGRSSTHVSSRGRAFDQKLKLKPKLN